MRIGVIGTGRHGSRYASHIVNDIDGLELAAICRRSDEGEEQAKEWDCTLYRDWQDLVSDCNVEAVIAVAPPVLNGAIARKCAAEGKSLLVEKPLAVSIAAAAEIVDLFSGRNLPLTVGHTLRYNQVIQAMRNELPSIGTLFSFSANQRLEPSTLAWHDDPGLAGAGVSFHTAVHVFDALRFITGLEVKRLIAVTHRQHNQYMEDLLAVLVEMEENVIGTIDCSKVGHARSGRFEFVGYDGQLHGDQVHNTIEKITVSQVEKYESCAPVSTIIPLLEDWRKYLAGEGSNPVSGVDGLQAVRLCEACLESARIGSWVNLPV
ncbi:MAG: Gfo/Idh/MocA family oxidoreductase [Desulfobulbaceae bacterium]|nr:Gfo/Idh/MocA family oxidoreductase [Desulfobulbaceae bacterium]